MAATRFSFARLVILAVTAAVLLECSAAATYTVGDTVGWVNSLPNTTFYSSWASQHTFLVGDILVFNYAAGQHDVARVTKSDYDACTAASPIETQRTSPSNFTLNAGDNYFFCTIGSHCTQGQKLAINVTSSTAPTPSPSPSTSGPPSSPPTAPSPTSSPPPTGTTTSPPPGSSAPPPSTDTSGSSPPPPPSSSAPPKAVAAFAVVFMSVAIGVLC